MIKQFTATVYIIQDQNILLIHHKKLNKWLPPGGHIESNETPADCAIREAKEETGLDIELIPQENIWINRWNAKSFERPYLCLLEEIPAHKDQPAHQHMDMIYIGKPIGGILINNLLETFAIQWFKWSEIEKLISEEDIFEETKVTIQHILSQHS